MNNKDKVFQILRSPSVNITIELLKQLEDGYNVEFEILDIPRFSFHKLSEKIRLFRFNNKIFL